MTPHVLAAWTALAGCGLTPLPPRPAGARAPAPEEALQTLFHRGLAPHWHDYGWAPRQIHTGEPAQVDFTDQQGWILADPEITGHFAALRFRLKSPIEMGDFLEVHLDSGRDTIFPRIRIAPRHRADQSDGWTEVRVPMSELNPNASRFDRVVLIGIPGTRHGQVYLDDIVLTPDPHPVAPTGSASPLAAEPTAPPAVMRVACDAPSAPISDLIYGIAVQAGQESRDGYFWQLGPTARRWGGNPTSTYNWKLGNAWNTGNDWFFKNVQVANDPDYSYRRVLDDDMAAGIGTALTVPLLGWVAKDTSSASFPASIFGEQSNRDPYSTAGSGVTKTGTPIEPGPPAGTSVPAPPAFVAEWVRQIRADDQRRGGRSVGMYILDNEPALWNSTHRDLHPAPVSYDELLERTLAYGSAVRQADPQAVIAGPAEWGWPAYGYSAVDAATKFRLNPDRLSHGNVPLLAWYLRKLREHETKTGERILNVLDVHYYPMADGVGGTGGGTDAKTAALRLRATRSLWDPTYVDESWIGEPVQLIPRLKKWVAENYPGVGISIGEWNFGAEQHISGGLAAAEALGRFGQQGVEAAFYWTYPPNHSPAFWAFRAYRNFDGKGAHFLSHSIPTTGPAGTSLFASRDESGKHVVLVALNLGPDAAVPADIDLGSCGQVTSGRAFRYSAETPGLDPTEVQVGGPSVKAVLDPYSITVFDLRLGGPAGGSAGGPASGSGGGSASGSGSGSQ